MNMPLTSEQRGKLGQELSLLRAAATMIEVQTGQVLERYGVDCTTGLCTACDAVLLEGEPVHHCADGSVLCAEHAPSWADLQRQLEAVTIDEPDAEGAAVVAASRDAIAAHVAGGGALTDKILHPL